MPPLRAMDNHLPQFPMVPPPSVQQPQQAAPVAPPAPPQLAALPPPQAPHGAHVQADMDANAARLRQRQQEIRNTPRKLPVTDLTLIIGMRTKQGTREEVIHDISSDYDIIDCTQSMKEKMRSVTEEGQYLGQEPTGEYELTLKVKYILRK